MVLGTLFVALGMLMYAKTMLLVGGMAGMALLLQYVTDTGFWLVFFLINVTMALQHMGWRFTLQLGWCTLFALFARLRHRRIHSRLSIRSMQTVIKTRLPSKRIVMSVGATEAGTDKVKHTWRCSFEGQVGVELAGGASHRSRRSWQQHASELQNHLALSRHQHHDRQHDPGYGWSALALPRHCPLPDNVPVSSTAGCETKCGQEPPKYISGYPCPLPSFKIREACCRAIPAIRPRHVFHLRSAGPLWGLAGSIAIRRSRFALRPHPVLPVDVLVLRLPHHHNEAGPAHSRLSGCAS